MRSASGAIARRRTGLSEKAAQRMVKALFDTNILIDYLNAVPEARAELRRYGEKAVSIITWMEVMAGAHPDLEQATRGFLERLRGRRRRRADRRACVSLRRSRRIKLPDAVIWATAQAQRASRHAQHQGFPARRSRNPRHLRGLAKDYALARVAPRADRRPIVKALDVGTRCGCPSRAH